MLKGLLDRLRPGRLKELNQLSVYCWITGFISHAHQLGLDERIHTPGHGVDLNARQLHDLAPAERDRGLKQARQDPVALRGGLAGEDVLPMPDQRGIGELCHGTRPAPSLIGASDFEGPGAGRTDLWTRAAKGPDAEALLAQLSSIKNSLAR